MAKKISWRDVPLTHAAEGRPATANERVAALDEYRSTSANGVACINDWFLCDVATFEAADDGDGLADVGPKVGDIDWTGFPVAGLNADLFNSLFGEGAKSEPGPTAKGPWVAVLLGAGPETLSYLPSERAGQHRAGFPAADGGERVGRWGADDAPVLFATKNEATFWALGNRHGAIDFGAREATESERAAGRRQPEERPEEG